MVLRRKITEYKSIIICIRESLEFAKNQKISYDPVNDFKTGYFDVIN